MTAHRSKSNAEPSKEDDSQSAQGVISTQEEEKRVEDRVAINAHVVYETIRREGEEELARSNAALAWSALAAGLSMGISFIAEALLKAHLPNQPWAPLVSRAGYAVGFLVVVLGRQQLFTENTLTVILPLMQRADLRTLLRVLRLWTVVLVANLVGTCLFAACIARIRLFEPAVARAFTEIAAAHIGAGFGIVFVRAIFAGWLIALMVWLLPGAESARVSIIIIVTYLVGLGGFNHIVAGSTTVFFLVVSHSLTWGEYFLRFFLPTLLGNIVGGVTLVAALGHAQVVGGREMPNEGRSQQPHARPPRNRKAHLYVSQK
jgi:formate-nitrite transporter family protein